VTVTDQDLNIRGKGGPVNGLKRGLYACKITLAALINEDPLLTQKAC
jgi:hypothetical protein